MMARHSAEIVPTRSGARRLFGRRDAVEVVGVSVVKPDHFTRLSPTYGGEAEGLFRFAVLPLRIAALLVLWATSSPTRAVFTVGVVVTALLAL